MWAPPWRDDRLQCRPGRNIADDVLDIFLDGPQSRTHFSSSSALKEKRVRRGHPTAVLLDLGGMSMKTSCRMPPRGEVHAGYSLSLKYEKTLSLFKLLFRVGRCRSEVDQVLFRGMFPTSSKQKGEKKK